MSPSPKVIVHIDGASRGNPGPAAYGVVMETVDGSRLAAFSGYLGKTTNNVAEYQGLLAALEHALSKGYSRIYVQTDSELLALQIKGVYRVKNAGLKPLWEQVRQLIARLESFSIEHVLRERNREADRLANLALDAARSGKRPEAVLPSAHSPLERGEAESASSLTSQPLREGEVGGTEDSPNPALKVPGPLHTVATFRKGVLEPHFQLSLLEGEVVDLEIYRKHKPGG